MFDEVTHGIHNEESSDHDIRDVEVRAPNPVRAAVVDVVSMRALARAFAAIATPPSGALDRALARTINLNGSIAEGILDERG